MGVEIRNVATRVMILIIVDKRSNVDLNKLIVVAIHTSSTGNDGWRSQHIECV